MSASVEQLSDTELRAELTKMGAQVGPITAGTRSVYEKKLEKLRKSNAKEERKDKKTGKGSRKSPVSKRKTEGTKRGVRAAAGASESEDLSDYEDVMLRATEKRKRRTEKEIIPGRANLSSADSSSIVNVSVTPSTVDGLCPPVLPASPLRPQYSPNKPASRITSFVTPRLQLPEIGSDRAFSGAVNPRNASSVRQNWKRGVQTARQPLNSTLNSSFLSPFAYSSAEDSDPNESAASTNIRSLVRRGWVCQEARESGKAAGGGRKGPLLSVLGALNQFRLNALTAIRDRLHSADKSSTYSPVHKRATTTSRYVREGREWRVNGDQKSKDISRGLLLLLFGFLFLLFSSYIGFAHGDKIKHSWNLVKEAGRDTIDFVFTYAILPSIVLALVAGVAVGCYVLERYQRLQANARKTQVFDMVDNIILVLRDAARSAKDTDDAAVAVPHIRDKLIAAADRKSKMPIWKKAMEHINESESRVSAETKLVNGQECLVWRWLPTEEKDVSWQGSAFTAAQADLNAPRQPYSECLKLRGMFNANQLRNETHWPQFIQDALLEKLGNKVKVVHMAVDKGSKEGVVFMKLFTKSDAESAYRILHGSWFDGHIVSVKYLRAERYHERFPDALKAAIPLNIIKPRHTISPF